MKKTLCVIFALMLCISVVFTGCNDDPTGTVEDQSGVSVDDIPEGLGDVRSDNKIEEGETVVETYLGTQVELFIGGVYYLEGTIYSSGTVMPVKLASDGKNYHYTTTISGISLGILILDGTAYLIEPTKKIYIEISDTLFKALGLDEGFDVSELTSINPENDNNVASKINQSAVTINGEKGLCNQYVYEDTTVNLYSIGDKLIQVDDYNENGVLSMQIVVDNIVESIPSDQLTLKGLEKSSITSFISALTGAQ